MDYDMLRKDINDALAKIGEKYNIDAQIGAIRYDESGFRTTIEAKVKVINGKSGAQIEYEMYAGKFGIDRNTFGKTFIHAGNTYRIVALDRNARKYPIIAMNVATGDKMKFPAIYSHINGTMNALPNYVEKN